MADNNGDPNMMTLDIMENSICAMEHNAKVVLVINNSHQNIAQRKFLRALEILRRRFENCRKAFWKYPSR